MERAPLKLSTPHPHHFVSVTSYGHVRRVQNISFAHFPRQRASSNKVVLTSAPPSRLAPGRRGGMADQGLVTVPVAKLQLASQSLRQAAAEARDFKPCLLELNIISISPACQPSI